MKANRRFHSFEELIDARKKLIEAHLENRFTLDDLLAEQYSDPSHFVYELLQNAEDEGATEVYIHLYANKFLFKHNGKPFDIEDVDGITGLGSSKKKEDLNTIGKFGLGFKSVFAVTQTPKIYSGEYAFKIKNFFLPEEPSERPEHLKQEETLIELPFNHPERSPQSIYKIIKNRIEDLGMITLLFLKNIEFISWNVYDDEDKSISRGQYLKELKNIEENVFEVQLISSKNEEDKEGNYLLFEDHVFVDNVQRKIQVAFLIRNNRVVPEEQDTNLAVYFPTEKKVYLHFLINGPFRTTPNREGVPFEDEKNMELLKGTLRLVRKSMLWLRNRDYISEEFFELLPYDRNNIFRDRDVFRSFYEDIKEFIKEEPLLPSKCSGEYLRGKEAAVPRRAELINLLNSEDLNMLFGKKNWIAGDIPVDRRMPLRRFLIEDLGVEEIDTEKLIRKLSELSEEKLKQFLESKSDEWMRDFYALLSNVKYLWETIKRLPIIRLEDGSHISPYDEKGNIKVYLPSEKYKNLGLRTVKETVFKDSEKAEEFLRGMEIKEPDAKTSVRERIKEIVSRYYNPEDISDSYISDFKNVLDIWQEESFRKEVEVLLKQDAHFILARNNKSDETKFVNPTECYYPDKLLKEYFKDYNVWFVDQSVIQISEPDIKKFLLSIGVENSPRIKRKVYKKYRYPGSWHHRSDYIEPPESLMNEIREFMEKRENDEWTWTYIEIEEPTLEGLDSFLSFPMTKERSKILWSILLQYVQDKQDKQGIKTLFQRKIRWTYYREYTVYMDSDLLKTLRNKPWMYNKEGKLYSPANIRQNELDPMYKTKDWKSSYLLELLCVCEEMEEIIEKLPVPVRHFYDKLKEKGIDPSRIPLEKIDEFVELYLIEKGIESSEDSWEPEIQPDEVNLGYEEDEPGYKKPNFEELVNQTPSENEDSNDQPVRGPIKREAVGLPKNTQKIGKWGEKAVLNKLREEYRKKGKIRETASGFIVETEEGKIYEVIWLNATRDKSKGYDIVVKKNGEEIEFIEVKTREDKNPSLFSVTGTQWEFAKALHERGKGEKYKIYVVSSAGTPRAKYRVLSDPYGMWKEGRIYAHPVNIRL